MDNNNLNVEHKKELKETRTVWKEIYEWIDCAVITVLCLILLFSFAFRQVSIDGSSMNNTLREGERVIVSDVFYKPQYGDIVVISAEVYDNVPIIKRVVATEGQGINITDGKVYVGETKETMKEVASKFTDCEKTDSLMADGNYGVQEYPLQIPENHVFVLGDNRKVSLDSRTTAVGLIDERQILGKALYRVYPFDRIGSIYK